jgi:hypothetical protein
MSYRLYVDEVGNDDIGNVSDERHRYLSLTGVAMKLADTRDVLTPRLDKLKRDIFRSDPDVPIILHRKDLLQRKGIFGKLNDPTLRASFDTETLSIIAETPYSVITVLIDKKGMLNQKHWINRHPYHYLMEILVEKYVQFLERRGSTGDIMPEKRHGRKDIALQIAFDSVREQGSDYVSRRMIAERIPSGTLKLRSKRENVAGLQLCDLIAHPSHIDVRSRARHSVEIGPFAKQITKILADEKYDRSRSGQIRGYGVKYLP